VSSSPIARSLVEALDDDALATLAVKLAPLLLEHLPVPVEDSWIDAKQAAAYLGITLSSLWKLTAAREIPIAQDGPGRKCWFRRSELDVWREGAWKQRRPGQRFQIASKRAS